MAGIKLTPRGLRGEAVLQRAVYYLSGAPRIRGAWSVERIVSTLSRDHLIYAPRTAAFVARRFLVFFAVFRDRFHFTPRTSSMKFKPTSRSASENNFLKNGFRPVSWNSSRLYSRRQRQFFIIKKIKFNRFNLRCIVKNYRLLLIILILKNNWYFWCKNERGSKRMNTAGWNPLNSGGSDTKMPARNHRRIEEMRRFLRRL